ncbi:MAG: ferritin-like domain-containing protein [Micromonosporaceae bacterium]
MRAQRAGSANSAVSALQAALAAEHAAVYGYGVAGAHLAGRQQSAAMRAWDAHRAMRDKLIAMVSARGAEPVAAADAYQLPFGVHSAHVAASLALELEEGVMRAYLGLVAVPDARLRVFGAQALQAAAVRAAAWRGGPTAFPGLPRSALASAAPARGKPGNAR